MRSNPATSTGGRSLAVRHTPSAGPNVQAQSSAGPSAPGSALRADPSADSEILTGGRAVRWGDPDGHDVGHVEHDHTLRAFPIETGTAQGQAAPGVEGSRDRLGSLLLGSEVTAHHQQIVTAHGMDADEEVNPFRTPALRVIGATE